MDRYSVYTSLDFSPAHSVFVFAIFSCLLVILYVHSTITLANGCDHNRLIVVVSLLRARTGQVADNGFTFDQLGIRIPTLAISPWIKKGTYAVVCTIVIVSNGFGTIALLD